MVAKIDGICPRCESATGPIGELCPNTVCQRQGYHLIPLASLDAARVYAEKRQRPIDPMIGRKVGRYLLASNLGQGGMGVVYLALQYPLMHEVALKVISDYEPTPADLARFEREARAISALDHPNIVKLYDFGFADFAQARVPYMAIEYIRHGRTLRSVLARADEKPPEPSTVLSIFRQILLALGAAHQRGIIHRDVKPENVMITSFLGNPNFVKILDFGLASTVDVGVKSDREISEPDRVVGTIHYMAPEQIPSSGQVGDLDGRVDLYAVGVMLYEVFCGKRPFEGKNVIEVIAKKVDPDYDPLDNPEVKHLARKTRRLLQRGLAILPKDRYQTATDMLQDLEDCLGETSTSLIGFIVVPDIKVHESPLIGIDADAAPQSSKMRDEGYGPKVPRETADSNALIRPPSEATRNIRLPSEANKRPPSSAAQKSSSGMTPISEQRTRPVVNPYPDVERGSGSSLEVDFSIGPPRIYAIETSQPIQGSINTTSDSRDYKVSKSSRRGESSKTLRWAIILVVVLILGWPAVSMLHRVYLINQARKELRIIKEALAPSGSFLGTASGVLDPGNHMDYFLREKIGDKPPNYPTRDPWGRRYRVRWSPSLKCYELLSTGPDGEVGLCEDEGDDLCIRLGQ